MLCGCVLYSLYIVLVHTASGHAENYCCTNIMQLGGGVNWNTSLSRGQVSKVAS